MKRKISKTDEDESRLSQLLFNRSKSLTEKLKRNNEVDTEFDQKPVWTDEDDVNFSAKIIPNIKSKALYTEKLKQKYEILMGTPNWAKFKKIDEDDVLLRTVGHLHKEKSIHLPKDYIEIKMFPKINSSTGNEGTIISCTEFHPNMSVALVGGQSGVVSIFSISGDVSSKLHSFELKNWKINTTHFTPDGSEAFISTKLKHSYCIYNLVKAVPTLVQLPKIVKHPKIFQMSSNGNFLAVSSGLDEIYLICTKSKELLQSLKHNSNVQAVAFGNDAKKLYCYCIQGEVVVWDLSVYRTVQKFYDHGCVSASYITTSPCGRLLATGSGEGIVNIYQISDLTTSNPLPQKIISNLQTKITALKFNATSEILASTSSYYPNAVKLIHLPSYHVFSNFPNQSYNLHHINSLSFSPNSGYMAIGNNKGCALLYRLKYYKNY